MSGWVAVAMVAASGVAAVAQAFGPWPRMAAGAAVVSLAGVVVLVVAEADSAAALASVVVLSALVLPVGAVRLAGGDRRGRRFRELVIAAVVAGGSVTLATAAARALAGSSASAGVLAPLLAAPLGVAAGASARARAASGAVVQVAIGVVALVIAGAVGFTVALVAAGHLPDDRQQTYVIPAALAAGLCALAYEPIRRRAMRQVRRAERPVDVLGAFGDRASRDVPEDEVLGLLAQSLRRSLPVDAVELWRSTAGEMVVAAGAPRSTRAPLEIPPAAERVLAGGGVYGRAWLDLWLPSLLVGWNETDVRVAPASHGGELLGLVVVERAGGGFQPEDDRALVDLGRRLGVVLHDQRLDTALQSTLADLRLTNRELRASRERLVAAADAERRRIERDLHDGAQQHLVALSIELTMVAGMLPEDPAGALEGLERLRGDVSATIAELRDLAHGIYPPLLMQEGLARALKSAARKSPVDVQIVADGERRFPSSVEGAVYFSCLEAVQNAAKHAQGSPVAVRLDGDDEVLRFEVVDEGPGFDPGGVSLGMGIQNIKDRIGAVGGTVQWVGTPGGGTTVSGTVPVGGQP
jgi:signal transduction histidine kinase